MEDPIQTNEKILLILKEQIQLYEIAIDMCYSHGMAKSDLLETLANRLRDKVIEHQKDVIKLQEKITEK